jgi:hypothetical protein
MKTLVAMVMAAGMTLSGYGQAVLSDIVTYEAWVMDDASSQVLASAGPWVWQDLAPQELAGNIEGNARTIVVKCRNAAGQTIFGGTLAGVDLFAPFSPFGPSLPGALSLVFLPDNYTVAVYLNGQEFIGEMLMLPAEDDPPPGPVTLAVSIDIKPGSVKNPFNVKSCGKLPVAILGSAELDVRAIDLASLKLATLAPVGHFACDIQGDGVMDLLLLFQDKAVAALVPNAVDDEVVGLTLTGALADGTLITGIDSITLQAPKPLQPWRPFRTPVFTPPQMCGHSGTSAARDLLHP